MRRIYEAVINTQRQKIETQFIENIANALGAKVSIEEPAQVEVSK